MGRLERLLRGGENKPSYYIVGEKGYTAINSDDGLDRTDRLKREIYRGPHAECYFMSVPEIWNRAYATERYETRWRVVPRNIEEAEEFDVPVRNLGVVPNRRFERQGLEALAQHVNERLGRVDVLLLVYLGEPKSLQ